MDELYKFVERLLGPEARDIFKTLYESGTELSEEKLVERTGLKYNVVRRSLNKLMEQGLVIYRKQRDPDTGKLTFLWRVNYESLKAILVNRKKAVIEKLRMRLEYERDNMFYVCPNDGLRFTFDEAMDYDMTCPRCGAPLQPDENHDVVVQALEEYIKTLEDEVSREARS